MLLKIYSQRMLVGKKEAGISDALRGIWRAQPLKRNERGEGSGMTDGAILVGPPSPVVGIVAACDGTASYIANHGTQELRMFPGTK